jgi:UDPglucose 6-dehydrogenase
MSTSISVIGLGKLGASMAAAFASRGMNVVGVDISERSVAAINAGNAPVHETGLDEMISANKARIRATLDHEDAILNSDITFVIVPTPSDDRGAFSLQYAEWAFREIGRGLAQKKTYHNVVLTSTVLPGATRQGLLPILERESGKRGGTDFGLCYSPEFIALGSIIENFLNPDFTLVGEIDERAGAQLEDLYSNVVLNGAPCARMSLENAELSKISINSFITTKITFANMLAGICERLPGGDVDVVTNALGLDHRIGRRYLKGAIGYGGPCFPRDNVALRFMANELGVDADIPRVTDASNRSLANKITSQVLSVIEKESTVAVLGLAYKPFSHVTEESPGVAIAHEISRQGVRVVAYDPLSPEMDLNEIRRDVLVLDSIEQCLAQARAVLIATPDPMFEGLAADDFSNEWSEVLVWDFWRILRSKLEDIPGIKYIGTGLSENDDLNSSRLRSLWWGEAGNKTPAKSK